MFDSTQQGSRERPLTVDDIPWLLSLAHRRFKPPPDPGGALTWLLHVVRSPSCLGLRTEGAALIAQIHTPIWWPDRPYCHVVGLVADRGYHWDTVRLLRKSIDWARQKRCVRWFADSETEADISILARRAGASCAYSKCVIELER